MKLKKSKRKTRYSAILLTMGILLSGCTQGSQIEPEQPAEKPVVIEYDKKLEGELEGRWYYDHLSIEEQELYNVIYQGYLDFKPEIKLDGVDKKVLSKVTTVIDLERPELYYVSSSYGYTFYENDKNKVYSIRPQYLMNKERYDAEMVEVNEVVDGLIAKIKKQDMGEYEAELYMHDYLVNKIEYDNENQEKGVDVFRNLYGAFVNGKANCMGYARAMTYVMNKLGIQCASIIGDTYKASGKTGKHEWNIIKINGDWYHLDICWDDPSYIDELNIEKKKDPKEIKHTFFNVSDSDISQTRNWNDTLGRAGEPPLCSAKKFNYYTVNDAIITSTDHFQEVLNNNIQRMMNEGVGIEVRFTDQEDYKKVQKDFSLYMKNAMKKINYFGTYSYGWSPDARMYVMNIHVTSVVDK